MSKIVCERYEGLSELVTCGKCEHVNVCVSYNEYVGAELSMVCERYLDYV
ncbi:hypothetical protein [Candidatus Magnetominusculus dajiuhuensis]